VIAPRIPLHSMANPMPTPMTHPTTSPLRGCLGICLGVCLGAWLAAGGERADVYRPGPDPRARLAGTEPVPTPPSFAPAGADPGIVPTQADLNITITDGIVTVAPGGSTVYTITASNVGPDAVIGATVSDTFPAALTCTWTCLGAGGGACTAAGSGNISDAVTLSVGGSVSYSATCAVSPLATGTLSNTAVVVPPGPVVDPSPGNNAATDSDTLAPVGANVTGSKTVSGDFTQGGTIIYTIVLTNTGGVQGDNPGHELLDVLPGEVTLVSATATSGTAVATLGTNTVAWDGSIPAGDGVTITITATINAAAGALVSSQAVFSWDSDGNGTNDANSVTDAFVCDQ